MAAIVLLMGVQTVVYVAMWVATAVHRNSKPNLSNLITGDSVSVASLLSAPVVFGFIWKMAALRRPYPVRDYLGLRPFTVRQAAEGVGALGLLLALLTVINHWVHQPPNAIMLDIFRTATVAPLLWLVIVVVVPIYEELVFRGFLVQGLSRSRIGPWGAVIAASAGWTAIHSQYGIFECSELFVLGLILGWLRVRTGSIWPAVIVHAVNNGLASLMIVLLLEGKIRVE